MSSMIEDLAASVTKAIEETVEPLKEQREVIVRAIAESKNEQRDLEAQLERVDRMIEASRLRKKAGRPSGRKPEPVAA